MQLRHLDLFSGIGGFALAAERVWPEIEHTFIEIDPFCQEVLRKHWPNAKIHGDIRSITNTEKQRQQGEWVSIQPRRPLKTDPDSDRPYLLTGGFPCQPFSQAGRRRGEADDRFLWPEMLRVIREFKPRWVIGENVAGIISMALDQVLSDLENEGYEVQAFVIPAAAVNAPHRRDRVWIVAHAKHECPRHSECRGHEERASAGVTGSNCTSNIADPKRTRHEGNEHKEGQSSRHSGGTQWDTHWFEVATRLCGVDDGLRTWVDGRGKVRNSRNQRLKALGNAIVPAVAEQIMLAIKLVEQKQV